MSELLDLSLTSNLRLHGSNYADTSLSITWCKAYMRHALYLHRYGITDCVKNFEMYLSQASGDR